MAAASQEEMIFTHIAAELLLKEVMSVVTEGLYQLVRVIMT